MKRLLLTLGACVLAAVVTAIAVGVLDLYLTGHGHGSLREPWFDHAPLGVHLSVGDLILWVVVVLVGAGVWHAVGRR